jgi:hypothetical protein
MASFRTHVSETQVTIGLITVLYNFSFDCLVKNLPLKNTFLQLLSINIFGYWKVQSNHYAAVYVDQLLSKMYRPRYFKNIKFYKQ